MLVISVDPRDISAGLATKQKLPFPILSDTDGKLIDAYHVRHKGGAPDGGDIALPAQFLIERGGVIRWRFLQQHVADRASPADVLAQVQKL